MHFSIHFARRTHEYPITLREGNMVTVSLHARFFSNDLQITTIVQTMREEKMTLIDSSADSVLLVAGKYPELLSHVLCKRHRHNDIPT